MGEHEGAPVGVSQPTLELPARERVQFTVLVDRTIDGAHEPPRSQGCEVLVKVGGYLTGLRFGRSGH
jgi:hypothetical protein